MLGDIEIDFALLIMPSPVLLQFHFNLKPLSFILHHQRARIFYYILKFFQREINI